jgi:hypothetical protein
MSYESVDALQKALTENVFHYAKDSKKAAGRALGTLVEIITFYLLKSWGYEKNIAIERKLPEYGNADITHNVEFTLHPTEEIKTDFISKDAVPLTAKKLIKKFDLPCPSIDDQKDSNQLLSTKGILRNACTLWENNTGFSVANLGGEIKGQFPVSINHLDPHPFAVVECKRVGVEEGVKKGPQTIEKAKQGAYVARTVSSLQKIRLADGSMCGVLDTGNGKLTCKPYIEFLEEIITSDDAKLLRNFTLTLGVVSNHGNWFTSNDHNKELKVLAQSYDWLLFLTDIGLSDFVEQLLIKPKKEYKPIMDAFIQSYTGEKGNNKFTKVKIALEADLALQQFFSEKSSVIENWFNVISPAGRSLSEVKGELSLLASKNWRKILS